MHILYDDDGAKDRTGDDSRRSLHEPAVANSLDTATITDLSPPTTTASALADHARLSAQPLHPPKFRHILILSGAPDASVVDETLLMTHECDRDETLVNIMATLAEYQRAQGFGAAVEGDGLVTLERVVLPRWPQVLERVTALARRLRETAPTRGGEGDGEVLDLLVFNLCDGSEIDGYPGASVTRDLERDGFIFTGSMYDFYHITTPKTLLKRYLQNDMVPTSDFVELSKDTVEADVDRAIARLGFPLIIKPSISYASLGITSASVTWDRPAAIAQARTILDEYSVAGCFVERFLAGREFTAVVTGHGDHLHVYPVAERAFNPRIKQNERLIAFDKYWDGYSLNGDRPAADRPYFFKYQLAPTEWQERLMDVARDAYRACQGSGYGRVDMRTASVDQCDVQVLEVNANCGFSFDDTSSLGEILRLSQVPGITFLKELMCQSVARWRTPDVAVSSSSQRPTRIATKVEKPLPPRAATPVGEAAEDVGDEQQVPPLAVGAAE
ncbi:hypothetical protein H9P43_008456 [Blastocladiella emersonii ATCC 22665]|nr:hypothetical protein H9P43_008456 [Blastocladiella emersonii ATCC 22665]